MNNVVVLLCYNDDDASIKYLHKTIGYKNISKFIVVDNGSNHDKTISLQKQINAFETDKIIYILNDTNEGYAKGNNIGITYALEHLSPDTIIISNTDVIVEEEVLEKAIKVLHSKDNIGIVSPQMKNPKGDVCVSAWKLPSFTEILWNSSPILKKIYNPQLYRKLSEEPMLVDVLPGSLLIANADAFCAVGGFDEDTFLYGEESLLAYKLKEKGYDNLLINSISYIHAHSTIINKNIKSYKKKMDMLYDSNTVYNHKCLRTNKLQDVAYYLFFYFNVLIMSILKRV